MALFRQSRWRLIRSIADKKPLSVGLARLVLNELPRRLTIWSGTMRFLFFLIVLSSNERKKIMSSLDFGIVGKKAIVCASSKGLGFGCANVAAVGVNLVMCARGLIVWQIINQLRKKAGNRNHRSSLRCDNRRGARQNFGCGRSGRYSVNNAGGPPGDFRDWTRDTWIAALEAIC